MSRLILILLILYILPHVVARLLARSHSLIPYETFWAQPAFKQADGRPNRLGEIAFGVLNHFGLIAEPKDPEAGRALEKDR